MDKRNLILFPTPIEKQVDIFRDQATTLTQHEFVICPRTSNLASMNIQFARRSKTGEPCANLQETLGISWYEGALVDAISWKR